MFDRAKFVLSLTAIPGRLASTAGTALFGAMKFNEYIKIPHLSVTEYLFPIISTVTTILTRIPSLFRSSKPENNVEEVVPLNSVVIEDQENEEEDIEQAQPTSCFNKSLSISLKVLCISSNILSSMGLILGSFNSGKVLCEFVARKVDGSVDDEQWKYYLIHGLALYMTVSNLQVYLAYVIRASNANCDAVSEALTSTKSLNISGKLASTAVIVASLNIVASGTINYISAKNSLVGIEHDINHYLNSTATQHIEIPPSLLMIISSSLSIGGMVTEIFTAIPSLYRHFDELAQAVNDDEELNVIPPVTPFWNKAMKCVTYPIGVVDAVITGVQSYTGIVLTAKDILHVDPYGYIINLGFLCAVSKTVCHFSFNVKKGIDDTIEDIEKILEGDAPVKKLRESIDPVESVEYLSQFTSI